MTFETGLRAGPTWLLRQRKRLMQPRAQPVLRVGIDIDGVIAKTGWNELPWTIANGWEAVDILDAEGLETAVSRVRENRWEGYAITARPTGPGRSVQQQTRRWLERHGASELSVVVDPGKPRGSSRRAGPRLAGRRRPRAVLLHGTRDAVARHLDTPGTDR